MFTQLLMCAFVACASAMSIMETIKNTTELSVLSTVLHMDAYKPVLDALSGDGPFTIFAPNNDAFDDAEWDTSQTAMVTQTLYYHVLGGAVEVRDLAALQFPESLMKDKVYVNLGGGKGQVLKVEKGTDDYYSPSAEVIINFGQPDDIVPALVTEDVACSNGVVHILDKVLYLPTKAVATLKLAQFTELAAALIKADLTAVLDNQAGLTIFAPTDEAMKAAEWETLDIPTLKQVLSYHVAPSVVYITDTDAQYTGGLQVKTLQGMNITLTRARSSQEVHANNATVDARNVLIENGVFHMINKVLMPPALK